MDKKEIENTAMYVAMSYVKKEYNREMVVTDIEFSSAVGSTVLFANGHWKDDKDNTVSVQMDYEQDFKVQSVGYDE